MKIYHKNVREFMTRSFELAEALKELSMLRLVTFIGFLLFFIILAYHGLVSSLWIVVLVFGFIFVLLIKRYNRVAYLKQHYTFLKEINENEILRLKNKRLSLPDYQD